MTPLLPWLLNAYLFECVIEKQEKHSDAHTKRSSTPDAPQKKSCTQDIPAEKKKHPQQQFMTTMTSGIV